MNADEPLPTRASLLERLKNTADDHAWAEFDRAYRGLLVGVARRAGLNEHETAEVVQETWIALARKLPEFRYEPGKDSFKGWLLQIVRWKIVDQARLRRRFQDGAEPPTVAARLARVGDLEGDYHPTADELPDPRQDFAAIWDAEWEHHLLSRALARVKRQANPEQYAIYHLREVEQRSMAEVRHTLDVTTAAIYLAKHRINTLVKKELLRLRSAGMDSL